LEHQHHLHGPAADAAHGGQLLDDGFIVEGVQRVTVGNLARQRSRSKITQCDKFAGREACAAQRRIRQGEHGIRCRESIAALGRCSQRDEARGDGACRGAADLLADDRFG